MAAFEKSTHIFKVVNGLSLEIDVLKPPTTQENSPVLLHFHGGFLILGQKTTFPPHQLINACQNRGWTYAAPSYRLLPEAKGHDTLQDAVDAIQWVHKNISTRVIIAGSSAGGNLALAATAHPNTPRPVAVLSIYGMLDPASERYIQPGRPLRGVVDDEDGILGEIEAATQDSAIDGYPFPADLSRDRRFRWIRAVHQAAKYPDLITGVPGLAEQIVSKGAAQSISPQDRVLFPVSFGLGSTFPPTVLLHGDADELVGVEQSAKVAGFLESLGVDVCFQRAEGQGHEFDERERMWIWMGRTKD